MSDWEIVRRQVAIGGNVRDADRALPGAYVTVTGKDPDAKAMHTLSRVDGSFFFLDLADGEYTVTATAGSRSANGPAHVQRKPDESLPMAWVDLQMQTA